MNMAINEVILQSRMENFSKTIRRYQWQPSAVSIEKSQNPNETIYTENCHKLGVDIVRRNSVGGTVFHDRTGELTYGVTAQTRDFNASDITEVYTSVYAAISDALWLVGMPADFNPGTRKNVQTYL